MGLWANNIIYFFRDYGISCTFNVNDLVDYKCFDCNLLVVNPSLKPFSERFLLTLLSDTHPIITEKVDKVLEDEIITTKAGRTHRYLDRYKEKIQIVDLQ